MTSAGHTLPVRSADETAAWPLHSAEATRAAEKAAAARDPQPALMARAGAAVARLGRALAPHARRTLVLAGPGNNGGDGLVAARLLHTARHPVLVRLVGDTGRLPADAARALRLAQGAGVQISAFEAAENLGLGPQDLAIDALLGIGSHRAPEGTLAIAIATCNDQAACTLSVDLPSGLHPDTGAVLGNTAVRAQATLALLTIKPGCLTGQGRDHAGPLWWNDLGQSLGEPSAYLAGHPPSTFRPHAAHKGSFGDVWLLGGARGMEGALVLAAGAALAAGAGRVLACPLTGGGIGSVHWRPELMLRAASEALKPTVLAQATVVAGCGGGTAIAESLPALLEHAARLVLDADALNHIAARQDLQTAVQWRARRGLPTVLTPHPLEAARLLGQVRDLVQADRLGAAQDLARRFQAVVVLKGSGTVIAAPDALPVINPTGNAALGTAGTGDVLAGWLGGLWSQAAAGPSTGADALATQAAGAAVWWHGWAADQHLAQGLHGPLRAAELIEALAQARS